MQGGRGRGHDPERASKARMPLAAVPRRAVPCCPPVLALGRRGVSYYALQCLLRAWNNHGEPASILGTSPSVGIGLSTAASWPLPLQTWDQRLRIPLGLGWAWIPGVPGRRVRWEGAFSLQCRWNWSSFFLSSDPGVIYSSPVVGRNGFSRAFLDLLENQGQEVPTSGREGGLWAFQEGSPDSPPSFMVLWFC